MEIQHEIVAFHPQTGSIAVRYFSDEIPGGLTYNIDLPIENGQFCDQAMIATLIQANKPTGQLERIVALQSVEIPPELASLIPLPPSQTGNLAEDARPVIEGTDAPPAV